MGFAWPASANLLWYLQGDLGALGAPGRGQEQVLIQRQDNTLPLKKSTQCNCENGEKREKHVSSQAHSAQHLVPVPCPQGQAELGKRSRRDLLPPPGWICLFLTSHPLFIPPGGDAGV